MMDVRQLKYFVAVAQELNFTRAARKLHMSTPSLSQQIRALERELGLELFLRTSHVVTLTAAGARLVPLARDILERFDALRWRLRADDQADLEVLQLGVVAWLHPILFSRLRDLLTNVLSGLRTHRHPGRPAELVSSVLAGDLDLAFVHPPVQEAGLDVLTVLSERLGVAVPQRRFGTHQSVRLHELTDLAFVMLAQDRTSTFYRHLTLVLSDSGIHRRLDLPTGDYSDIAHPIANGEGFCLVPMNVAKPGRIDVDAEIAILPVADAEIDITTALVWRADRARPGGDLARLAKELRQSFTPAIRL